MQKSFPDTSAKTRELSAHREVGLTFFVGACLMAVLASCGDGATAEENTPEQAPLAEMKSELSAQGGACTGTSYINTYACSTECQLYTGTEWFCYTGQPWQCKTATYELWYVRPHEYSYSLKGISETRHNLCSYGPPSCPTFCNN